MLEQETKKREGIASISNVQKYFLVFRSPMTRKHIILTAQQHNPKTLVEILANL